MCQCFICLRIRAIRFRPAGKRVLEPYRRQNCIPIVSGRGVTERRLPLSGSVFRAFVIAAVGFSALQLAACTSGNRRAVPPGPSESNSTRFMSTAPASTEGSRASLPGHFEIQNGDLVSDCRISADSVTCNETLKNAKPTQSYAGTMTGKVAGMTVTGSARSYATYPDPQSPECTGTTEMSGPITFTFSPDGTLSARWGPYQRRFTNSCLTSQPEPNSGEDPNREPISEWTATWSPLK